MNALLLALLLPLAPGDDAHTWEDAQLARVLNDEKLVMFAPSPADRIAFIRIVRHEVLTPEDPWPDWLNAVHRVTDEDVVARELLFTEGGRYERLEETARNLRSIFIFSLVRVVPVRNVAGQTGVAVFTRDLWSLRFEQGFQVTGSSIDRLALQLSERNVFGRAKVASVRFTLDPSSWSLGEAWIDRRIWGSGIRGVEAIDVFFSRAHGSFDGSAGSFALGAPLMSFGQPSGFDVIARYEARTIRQFRNGAILVYDAPNTAEEEAVPRVWGQRSLDLEAALHRQFTRGPLVHRLSVGLGASDDFAEPIAETGLPAALETSFAADVLPVVRRTVFPFAAVHVFSPRHRVYEDLDTFGVSEAVRLGPSLAVTVGAGSRALLSSSDTIFATGTVGAALAPLGSLLEAAAEAGARYEDGTVVNRTLAARLRLATAPVAAGRFLFRADATFRSADVTNVLVSIGGDNGLRGYPSQAFFAFGASVAQATAEWRSLPIDVASAQLGLAAFYDAGSVFSSWDDAALHHSVGVGLRLLFPQFNRGVYRFDFAVPLDDAGIRVQFSVGDTQAVEHANAAFDRLTPRR